MVTSIRPTLLAFQLELTGRGVPRRTRTVSRLVAAIAGTTDASQPSTVATSARAMTVTIFTDATRPSNSQASGTPTTIEMTDAASPVARPVAETTRNSVPGD